MTRNTISVLLLLMLPYCEANSNAGFLLGCFQDLQVSDSRKALASYHSPDMSLSSCLDLCGLTNFTKAAVKNDSCICADEDTAFTDRLVSEETDRLACPGNKSESCGFLNCYEVYSTGFPNFKYTLIFNPLFPNNKLPTVVADLPPVNLFGKLPKLTPAIPSIITYPTYKGPAAITLVGECGDSGERIVQIQNTNNCSVTIATRSLCSLRKIRIAPLIAGANWTIQYVYVSSTDGVHKVDYFYLCSIGSSASFTAGSEPLVPYVISLDGCTLAQQGIDYYPVQRVKVDPSESDADSSKEKKGNNGRQLGHTKNGKNQNAISLTSSSVIICAKNKGTQEDCTMIRNANPSSRNDTGILFRGVHYERFIPLRELIFGGVQDCVMIPPRPPINVQWNWENSGSPLTNGTLVSYKCSSANSHFEDSSSDIVTATCLLTAKWNVSYIPSCTLIGKMQRCPVTSWIH